MHCHITDPLCLVQASSSFVTAAKPHLNLPFCLQNQRRGCVPSHSHGTGGGESSGFISAHPVHCLVSAVTSTQCCGLSASAHHNQRGAASPAVHLEVQGGLFLVNLLLLIYKKLRCEPTFSPVLTKPLKALTRISRHSKVRLPCSGLA